MTQMMSVILLLATLLWCGHIGQGFPTGEHIHQKHDFNKKDNDEIEKEIHYFTPIKNVSPYFNDLETKYPYLKYIDVFYGTESGGHTFPGTNLPFGMCKIGVDILNPNDDSYAGYDPYGYVDGVSMLHLSGTGGAPNYGIVSQIPYTQEDMLEFIQPIVAISPTKKKLHWWRKLINKIMPHFKKDDQETVIENTLNNKPLLFPLLYRASEDIGHLGYYKVSADNNVTMEFSSGYKSGIIKYGFPEDTLANYVLVNVSHHLHSAGRPWWTQNFQSGQVKVNKDNKSYQGMVVMEGGWASPDAYTVFFYGIFNKPFNAVFETINGTQLDDFDTPALEYLFQFTNDNNKEPLVSHVGISFNSITEAKINIATDFSEHNFDLAYAVQKSVEIWHDDVFDKFQNVDYNVESPIVLEKLYTSIYGSHLMPTNKTGPDSPFYSKTFTIGGETQHSSNAEEPYYDDWFTIWDTFRSLHPMINIVNKGVAGDLVRSLIQIWKYEGFMPDGRCAGRSGRTQGGSNSDIVMADALVKNITSGIDWEQGFQAMRANAEIIPPFILDPIAQDSTNKFGRGALKDWLQYGYVTRNFSRSVTRTIEYSYNDFALATVAQKLGHQDLYERYLERSSNWQNIWNFEATLDEKSYRGFIGPKNSDGKFNYQNYSPIHCGQCYWSDDEYEGSPVEYGWSIPYDMATLHDFIGDNETFSDRLDDMFGLHGGDRFADIGNEPSFLTPYLYNFINRNDKTSETLQYFTTEKFKTGTSGLPGNSDAGSMQSWLWFALIGIYPIAGTDIYLIGSPQITHWELREDEAHDTGRTVFRAENLFQDNGARNIYIERIILNGEPLERNWIQHEELFGYEGGEIQFFMTESPRNWDRNMISPPSKGHFERNDVQQPK